MKMSNGMGVENSFGLCLGKNCGVYKTNFHRFIT